MWQSVTGPSVPVSPFQEQQYARWMAGCRLASKGRTMADSSYASEVQAILAFLSLQRAGGGGAGSHPQGPDTSAEGLNPYGLVAPRFQRKFKAKQVPGTEGGNDESPAAPTSEKPSSTKPRAHSLLSRVSPRPFGRGYSPAVRVPPGLLSPRWGETALWWPHSRHCPFSASASVSLTGRQGSLGLGRGPFLAPHQHAPQLTPRILEAHQNVAQLSLTEALLRFIQAWQSLPDFGISYVMVR